MMEQVCLTESLTRVEKRAPRIDILAEGLQKAASGKNGGTLAAQRRQTWTGTRTPTPDGRCGTMAHGGASTRSIIDKAQFEISACRPVHKAFVPGSLGPIWQSDMALRLHAPCSHFHAVP